MINFYFLIINILFFSSFIDFKKKNINNIFLKNIILLILIFNILIFNLRFYIEYSLVTYLIYVILLGICFIDLPKSFLRVFCTVFILYIIVYSPFVNRLEIKKVLFTRDSNLDYLCNDPNSEFRNYSKRFKENTYSKLCY